MDILSIGQALGTLGIGAVVVYQWWDGRRKEAKKPDLGDMDYEDLLGEDLELLQSRTEAMRVTYWAFTNGTMTADNYSVKNLSCMVERNREGVDSIIHELQRIPCIKFRRNLAAMREAETYIVTHEHNKNDALAQFHKYYGLNSNIFVKVFNKGKWTGIIGLNFEDIEMEFSPELLSWITFQTSIIGNKLKQLKK